MPSTEVPTNTETTAGETTEETIEEQTESEEEVPMKPGAPSQTLILL